MTVPNGLTPVPKTRLEVINRWPRSKRLKATSHWQRNPGRSCWYTWTMSKTNNGSWVRPSSKANLAMSSPLHRTMTRQRYLLSAALKRRSLHSRHNPLLRSQETPGLASNICDSTTRHPTKNSSQQCQEMLHLSSFSTCFATRQREAKRDLFW